MKRSSLFTLGTILFAVSLSSCGTGGLIKPDYKTEGVKLGILKYVNDAPLNEAENAFLARLNQEGIKYSVDKKDGNADANLVSSSALTLVSDCNLVLAIATPAATAVVAARETKSRRIPTLFTAVTDPVFSQIVAPDGTTNDNVTGTSDMNPVADQIAIFKEINPSIKTIGFIYSSNETNSIRQKELAQAKCNDLGITLKAKSFSENNLIASTVDALIEEGIKGLYIPTDNNCVKNFQTIKAKTDAENIPVIAGEGTVVDNGAIASHGISYTDLGKKTAEQAIDIINGKDIKDIPVSVLDHYSLVVNKKHALELGITLPSSLLQRADRVIE